MPMDYKILILHDSGNTGPGDVISAGFTTFVLGAGEGEFDAASHSILTQSPATRTAIIRNSDKTGTHHHWDGSALELIADFEPPSSSNTNLGDLSLFSNTTGDFNTAVGKSTLLANDDGVRNTAVGNNALTSNNSGGSNTAVGDGALISNTVGSENIGLGRSTLSVNQSGKWNTALGAFAGQSTTSDANTSAGYAALLNNTSGENNTAVGYGASLANFTGDSNTALGYDCLRYKQDAGNNIDYSNCSGLGNDCRVSASNQVQLGDSATTTYAYGAIQNRSDARDKTDVEDSDLGLNFILSLNPVSYRMNYRDNYYRKENDKLVPVENDGSKSGSRRHYGLIAQEVKATLDLIGKDFGGYQDHSVNGGCDVKTLGYDEFISPLIKAIHDLNEKLENMEKRIKVKPTRPLDP